MANVPVGTGPQNSVQPKPVQPAVLTNNPVTQSPNTINASVVPKQASNSPWDDDLDTVNPPVKNPPTIIGSLDPKTSPPKTDVSSLKMPENVEETVGKKIPAADFIGVNNAQDIVPKMPNQPKQKKSPGILGGLFRKTTEAKKVETAVKPTILPEKNISNPAEITSKPTNVASLKGETRSNSSNSIIKKLLILVPGLVVVLALAIFLTEMGLLSLGLEKVYGALGIEQLWGGLSPKTENALGRSALVMQNHPDFKADGKINITIDRAIKSDIVTPLLVLTTGQSLARDESINPAQKATKTASDDYYFTTNSNSNSNINSNSNLNSNSNTNSNLNNNSNSSNINSNINSYPVEITTGTKLVEGVFDLKTSGTSNEATIKLNDEASSLISLVNNKNQLFVKTNGAVNYGSTDEDKWLVFNIDQLKDKSVISSLFNLKVDSGFSVKGVRAGNEKVDKIRCYKYRIDSLEIGSSLSGIGITSDMVPTLSGDVWIGIKDKLIHKMSVKITTPVSSAVRTVNLDISFLDFDVKNSITTVSSADQIVGAKAQSLSGDEKRKADIANLLNALKQYKNDNGKYPIASSFVKLNSINNAVSKVLIPRYLTSLPEDSKASQGWYYAYKSIDGTKCAISARLENQSDTEGTLVNNVLLYFKDSSD